MGICLTLAEADRIDSKMQKHALSIYLLAAPLLLQILVKLAQCEPLANVNPIDLNLKDELDQGGLLKDAKLGAAEVLAESDASKLADLAITPKRSPANPWTSKIKECKDASSFAPRLPLRIVPIHYDLDISLLKQDEFEGSVRIIVQAGDESKKKHNSVYRLVKSFSQTLLGANMFMLNAHESLSINSIGYTSGQDGKLERIREVCRAGQTIRVTIHGTIPDGARGTIAASFSGSVDTEGAFGLFRMPQRSPSGRQTALADDVTQFESTYARRVFPCFDEPAFKATFKLSITHPSHKTALANTLAQSQKALPDGFTTTEFKMTPVVSSYLVAFAVGDYDQLERRIKDDQLLVRVFTEKGGAERGQLALEVGCDTLLYLEQYTGIPYPLEKIDLIVGQHEGGGAMENWGLVTFEGDMLYYDPKYTDLWSKRNVVTTVVHELAHQWFGNLVTMEWWSDLWLNEAFAQFFSQKIAAELAPDLDFASSLLIDDLVLAFDADSDAHAHPIQRKRLDTVESIEENFDSIVYNKGAMVLRMLESLVGEEGFKRALGNYLGKKKYSNTKQSDLLEAFEELKSPYPIKKFFASWFNQAGFPLVSVSLDERRRQLVFHQERFAQSRPKSRGIWYVPLTVMFGDTESGRREMIRSDMLTSEHTMKLPDWFKPEVKSSWLKVNQNFQGFYYVNYERKLFGMLETALSTPNTLSPADKFNLLHELNALVSANQEYEGKLTKLIKWTVESDPMQHGVVWAAVAQILATQLRHHERETEELVKQLMGPYEQQLGFKKSSPNGSPSYSDDLGRTKVLELLIKVNHQPTIEHALAAYDEARDEALEPNLREPIYLALASYGSEQQMQHLMKRLDTSPSDSDRRWIASALASSRHPDILRRIYEHLKSMDLGEKNSVLHSFLFRSEGMQFLTELINDESEGGEFEQMVETFGDDDVEGLIESLCIKTGKSLNDLFPSHSQLKVWSKALRCGRAYHSRLDDVSDVESVTSGVSSGKDGLDFGDSSAAYALGSMDGGASFR